MAEWVASHEKSSVAQSCDTGWTRGGGGLSSRSYMFSHRPLFFRKSCISSSDRKHGSVLGYEMEGTLIILSSWTSVKSSVGYWVTERVELKSNMNEGRGGDGETDLQTDEGDDGKSPRAGGGGDGRMGQRGEKDETETK